MNPTFLLLLIVIGAIVGLQLLNHFGSDTARAWARGVLLWSGMLWAGLTLLLLATLVAAPDSTEARTFGYTLAGTTLMSLCLGGSFFTGGFLAEWLGVRFRWRTWLTQGLALLTTAPSVLAGFSLQGLLLWAILDREPFWQSRGIAGMFDSITLWLLLNTAFLIGLVRLLYNVRLQGLEADRTRLSAETTAARLTHLEERLRPHFLYNALSGLAGLIREDPERAEMMTLALARLLRRSLDGADAAPTLPLRAELDLVRDYLAVEQERFGDRLRVSFDVDEAAQALEIPRLTLQPLVENAIKHGLAKTGRPVHISVVATREGRRLRLAVADDGPPFPLDLNGGHGLTSVTERLTLLYGDDFAVRFANARADGTAKRVELDLPATLAAAPAPPRRTPLSLAP